MITSTQGKPFSLAGFSPYAVAPAEIKKQPTEHPLREIGKIGSDSFDSLDRAASLYCKTMGIMAGGMALLSMALFGYTAIQHHNSLESNEKQNIPIVQSIDNK